MYIYVCMGKIFPTLNITVLFLLYKPILFPTATYRELGIYHFVELFSIFFFSCQIMTCNDFPGAL